MVSPGLATIANRLHGLGICLTLECFYVTFMLGLNLTNAFRVVLKCAKYTADVEYGLVEMVEQEHELWLDRSSAYSLSHCRLNFKQDFAMVMLTPFLDTYPETSRI